MKKSLLKIIAIAVVIGAVVGFTTSPASESVDPGTGTKPKAILYSEKA
ncbi:hypothetical protein [Robertmurraya siralis]|nr:hypothetical protein [Robertmurraya siralis]